MESNIPCVLVASKVDLPEVKQFHGMTPAEFCYKHRLPPPLRFSSLDSANKNIFSKIAWAAVNPYVMFTTSYNNNNKLYLYSTLGNKVTTCCTVHNKKIQIKRHYSKKKQME